MRSEKGARLLQKPLVCKVFAILERGSGRGLPLVVLDLGRRAVVKQLLDDLRVPKARRVVQCRVAIVVAQVGIEAASVGLGREQPRDDVRVTPEGRLV
eukprot:scaffold126771_cov28-Tisochrysis_lutea.AAC.2